MPMLQKELIVSSIYYFVLFLTTLRLVSIQAEGIFGRLRYSLGGDRPSQTAHLALSNDQFHGLLLEFQ